MLFAIENLPYWIFLGLGLGLFLLALSSQTATPRTAGAGLDTSGLPQTVLEVSDSTTAPNEILAVQPDNRQRPVAPLSLRMSLTLATWGLLGWLANIGIGSALGVLPQGILGFGVVTVTLILALIISHQLVAPLGWVISSRRNQSSLDYLVGCTGEVNLNQVNRLTAGEITEIDVTDARGDTLSIGAVLPSWAKVMPQPGDRITLIERLEQGQIYHAVTADSSDQDHWLRQTAAIR